MPYKDLAKRRANAVIRQRAYLARHPEKAKAKKKAWYERNKHKKKDKHYNWTRQWRANNPEKMRAVRMDWVWNNYEKVSEYKKQVRKTKREKRDAAASRPRPDRCEVCQTYGEVVYDHDHVSGKFRTWACHRCNRVMGAVKDDPAILRALADHLEKFQRELND